MTYTPLFLPISVIRVYARLVLTDVGLMCEMMCINTLDFVKYRMKMIFFCWKYRIFNYLCRLNLSCEVSRLVNK